MTNPVTVQSVNGPEFTVIWGGTNIRCVWLASGASLSGFTLYQWQPVRVIQELWRRGSSL